MLQIQWLGVNAFRFTFDGKTVLLDPYVTRDPDRLCDPALARKHFPHADAIVVSHSHWDHLADTPALAEQTGAEVIGSRTTCNICRAFGIPDRQLIEMGPRAERDLGGWSVRFLPSLHMALADGTVAFAGTYESPPSPPRSRQEYLEGGSFAVLFDFGGNQVLNIGSANLIDKELEGLAPQTLLLGIGGWQRTPRYLERVLSCVSPRLVIPSHHDDLLSPLADGLKIKEPEAVAAFTEKMKRIAPHVHVRVLDLFETIEPLCP